MSNTSTTLDQVDRLLEQAAGHPDPDAAARVDAARRRLAEPIRVAIAGKVKAGKSTLLNALVGERLAPTDAGECTRVVTWYADGLTYRVTAQGSDGTSRQLPFTREDGSLLPDLGPGGADGIERLDVEWPSQRLREMTLIDTPGIESISTEVSDRTRRFLGAAAGDDSSTQADAVIYLMRHMHSSDLRFLEAFHGDGGLAQASPLNAIGVLSRADEVGACRDDAMRSAAQIADRYQRDAQVGRLCQTMVPVAGLVAETATTLREEEFQQLRCLATHQRDVTDRMLLTVDRFVAEADDVDLTVGEREHLLDRLGLYGLRISVKLLRVGGVTTSSELCAGLLKRSGIERLRSVLLSQLADRGGLLKARSAMQVLEDVLRHHRWAEGDRLLAELERIRAEAHAFNELRALDALRRGAISVSDDERSALDRLFGGAGTDPSDRLAADPETTGNDPATLTALAHEALVRWQRRAEHPLSDQETAEVARVAMRSCEGLIAGLQSQPVSG